MVKYIYIFLSLVEVWWPSVLDTQPLSREFERVQNTKQRPYTVQDDSGRLGRKRNLAAVSVRDCHIGIRVHILTPF